MKAKNVAKVNFSRANEPFYKLETFLFLLFLKNTYIM